MTTACKECKHQKWVECGAERLELCCLKAPKKCFNFYIGNYLKYTPCKAKNFGSCEDFEQYENRLERLLNWLLSKI